MTDVSVRAYNAGICAALRCRVVRVWLALLRLIFRFDRWHAAAPYSCRAYKRAVVELANALHPESAVEVGCGLGDIISRINASERVGIDSDRRVIRAARFLHPTGEWIQADGAYLGHLVRRIPRIDCLIMVNWIHTVSPADLAATLLPLLPNVRYLILDAIDPDAPQSYRYRHDFGFLDSAARRMTTARVRGEPRAFTVFESLR